jgi:hypothetical protein
MARSLEGLIALFLLAGAGILWGVRGWRSWSDLAWLSGVAYVNGLAAVCLVGTLVLVFGGALSAAAILLIASGVTLAGAAAGLRLARPLPRGPGLPQLPRTPADLAAFALSLVAAALAVEL